MSLKNKVEQWFVERNLDKSSPRKQFLKLVEETGELFEGIAKGNNDLIKDALGDMQVVLVGLEMQLENKSDDSESLYLDLMNDIGLLAYSLKVRNPHASKNLILTIRKLIEDIAKENQTTSEECLEIAYEEIKDRKGKMVDGVFVKEEDL